MVFMIEKYDYSLNGFDVLMILELAKQGKHCILAGDNKFKVVDNENEELKEENEHLKEENKLLKDIIMDTLGVSDCQIEEELDRLRGISHED